MNTISHDIIAAYWLIKKQLFKEQDDTANDFYEDHIAPFDEYCSCPVCKLNDFYQKFESLDGMLINQCKSCGLLQTRPRISENIWYEWLAKESERSKRYTENRLRYGYALDKHIKYSTSLWRLQKRLKYKRMFKKIANIANRKIIKMHDVGCGVGFLIQEAMRMNIKASGNDLNQYSVKVMEERFGLDVTCGTLESDAVQKKIAGSDLVTMTDYIEHSYHPDIDLKNVYDNLNKKGLLYLTTFHIDCSIAKKQGHRWNMYCWNHVYHFDRRNLEKMIRDSGFKIIYSSFPYSNPHCEIIAER
jgi:2-polyprenyl-3-methyl-5-hydroxy-6-metoxy-1,4-benzoquinol methylase